MAERVVVASEADLWLLLERALHAPRLLLPGDQIHVGWQPQLLYFPDEPIGPSISPAIARAVAGFHGSLSRSYAFSVYGRSDARLLRAEDEAALDLKYLVVPGSNGFEAFGEALDRLAHALIHKLTGQQVFLLLILFLLLNFGETFTKDWLHETYAEKAQEAEAARRLQLSEEETRRMQIFANTLGVNPGLIPLVDIAKEGKPPLVRSIIPYGRGSVLGTEITSDQARTIVSKEKPAGVAMRLDGRFEVVELDIENPEGHRGTLRDVKTHEEVKVSINRGELPETDVQTLFEALRGKTNVDALVNAWKVGDKITFAAIVRANKVP